MLPLLIAGGALQAAGGIGQYFSAKAGEDQREKERKAAIAEMNKYREQYKNLDTRNLQAGVRNQFRGMENTFEDITVNQQQAQFEAQQGAQQRANIMQNLRGAAGASGVAGLAQAMAQQGALATQRASASIGAQESRLQFAKAQEGSRLQTLEREGELKAQQARLKGAETARGLDYQKTSTLLGMSQQRTAAARQAEAQAKAQQMEAFGNILSAGTSLAAAYKPKPAKVINKK